MADAAGKFPAGAASYWLRFGGVDGEEAEGLGLDRGWGGNQGKAVGAIECGGHLVEGTGGEIAQQALEAVDWAALGRWFCRRACAARPARAGPGRRSRRARGRRRQDHRRQTAWV